MSWGDQQYQQFKDGCNAINYDVERNTEAVHVKCGMPLKRGAVIRIRLVKLRLTHTGDVISKSWRTSIQFYYPLIIVWLTIAYGWYDRLQAGEAAMDLALPTVLVGGGVTTYMIFWYMRDLKMAKREIERILDSMNL